MATTTPQTHKQPKTVALSTYFQSIAIAVLITGIVAFIASYFVTVHIYDAAHARVSTDIVQLSKDAQ